MSGPTEHGHPRPLGCGFTSLRAQQRNCRGLSPGSAPSTLRSLPACCRTSPCRLPSNWRTLNFWFQHILSLLLFLLAESLLFSAQNGWGGRHGVSQAAGYQPSSWHRHCCADPRHRHHSQQQFWQGGRSTSTRSTKIDRRKQENPASALPEHYP